MCVCMAGWRRAGVEMRRLSGGGVRGGCKLGGNGGQRGVNRVAIGGSGGAKYQILTRTMTRKDYSIGAYRRQKSVNWRRLGVIRTWGLLTNG